MATIKIKQVKGQAGRPIDQKSTLESLGLGKINRVVEREDSPFAWYDSQGCSPC